MAFWGISIEAGGSHTIPASNHPRRLRLSRASVLDGTTSLRPRCAVYCSVGGSTPVIIFRADHLNTVSINLEFEETHDIVFALRGPCGVHLSGFYIDRIHDVNASPPMKPDAAQVVSPAEMVEKLQSILKNVTTIERYLNKIGVELVKEIGQIVEGGLTLEHTTNQEKDEQHLLENRFVHEAETNNSSESDINGVNETGIDVGSLVNSISNTFDGSARVLALISPKHGEVPKEAAELESVAINVNPDIENESGAIVNKSNEEIVETNHIFRGLLPFSHRYNYRKNKLSIALEVVSSGELEKKESISQPAIDHSNWIDNNENFVTFRLPSNLTISAIVSKLNVEVEENNHIASFLSLQQSCCIAEREKGIQTQESPVTIADITEKLVFNEQPKDDCFDTTIDLAVNAETQQVDSSVRKDILEVEKCSSAKSLILQKTNNGENESLSESKFRKKKQDRNGDVAADELAQISHQEKRSLKKENLEEANNGIGRIDERFSENGNNSRKIVLGIAASFNSAGTKKLKKKKKKESINQPTGDHGHGSDKKSSTRSDDCNLLKPESSKQKNIKEEATGDESNDMCKMSCPSVDKFSDDPHHKERKHRKRKREHKDSKIIPNYPVESAQVDLPVPTKVCDVGKTNDGENESKSAPIVKKKKKHRNVDVATDEQAKVSPEENKSLKKERLEEANSDEGKAEKKCKSCGNNLEKVIHGARAEPHNAGESDDHFASEKATKVSSSEKAKEARADKIKKSLVDNGVDSSSAPKLKKKNVKKQLFPETWSRGR